jgi:hypothetical protein
MYGNATKRTELNTSFCEVAGSGSEWLLDQTKLHNKDMESSIYLIDSNTDQMCAALSDDKGNPQFVHDQKIDIKTPGTVREFSIPCGSRKLYNFIAITEEWQASRIDQIKTKIVTVRPRVIVVNDSTH